MSQDNCNFIQSLPSEIYREFFFYLDPISLINKCLTNHYANQIYNENFIRDYIIRNFDPKKYNIELWENNIFQNHIFEVTTWNDLFKKLLYNKTVDIIIFNPKKYKTDIKFKIYFSDNYSDIEKRFKIIEKDNDFHKYGKLLYISAFIRAQWLCPVNQGQNDRAICVDSEFENQADYKCFGVTPLYNSPAPFANVNPMDIRDGTLFDNITGINGNYN